ncbi:hypothetical protein RM96_24325 [Cupriavidus sp. IDO]|nr:hypothetical protein RM96_24325 [Cupriavidus sp. IDO]
MVRARLPAKIGPDRPAQIRLRQGKRLGMLNEIFEDADLERHPLGAGFFGKACGKRFCSLAMACTTGPTGLVGWVEVATRTRASPKFDSETKLTC